MKKVLCTLFGFSYLDKGLVLYESLERVAGDFVLYVLAMDDDCYSFLHDCRSEKMVVIRLSEFENDALRFAKSNRSFGEYCWTCSASLIQFVLDYYNEPCCAYIDADMAFYSDPAVLFDELEQRGGSVMLTGHRFNRFEHYREFEEGRYCVEFNLFLNNSPAKEVLAQWVDQCLQSCSADNKKAGFGDQQYLNGWAETYDFVVETMQLGAGVAPWNISQYKLVSHDEKKDSYLLRVRGKEVDLVFFHFAGIKYRSRELADISLYSYWHIDDCFVAPLYSDYLQKLERYKQVVQENTGREILLYSHPAFSYKQHSLGERIISLIRRICSRNGIKHFLFVEIPQKLQKSKNMFHVTSA